MPIDWLSEGRLKTSLLLRHSPIPAPDKSQLFMKLLLAEPSSRVLSLQRLGFQEMNEEALRAASNDYLRCILAKSVAEVYRKETSRYRNEAARNQFFRRLLEVFESCNLLSSSQPVQVVAFSDSDRVADWVKSEFDRHVNDKHDISSEHESKLNTAHREFKRALQELEELTGCAWRQSERFNGSVSLVSLFPPELLEDENTWRWGTQPYYNSGTILNVNPPLLLIDPIRFGLLAREAGVLLSPMILDRVKEGPRVLCEQSEYFAYRLLGEKNDKELWAQARHGLRKSTRERAQDLIEFFEFYEMMVGDRLYVELWSRLREFGSARLNLSDYNIVFNSLASRPIRQRFNPTEVRLINLLARKPEVKAGEIARSLRMSIPTAMKATADLIQKAGLRFTVIVDMRKLGLIEHLLLLRTSRVGELMRILYRFPYCRQVFRTYGSSDLFCVVDVPYERVSFTADFVGNMKSRQLVTDSKILALERDFQTVNFGRYDPIAGRWDVHWDSWGINLREAISEKTDRPMWSIAQNQRVTVDRLDLKILSSLQTDCRMPYAAMGRFLGVSGAYVGRKVERLSREHVFRYAIWPLKIAAEDWGILSLSCNRTIASILAEYLNALPAWRGGYVTGDYEGLLAMVWAPSGEMKQLFKAIDDRLIRNGQAVAESINSVGEWLIARWLPVDATPWDLINDNGEWIFDETAYQNLLS